MRGRVPRRVKRTTNFIPAGDTFFSSLFCYAHFQSRKFGGTFFVSAIDFCLQDSRYRRGYCKAPSDDAKRPVHHDQQAKPRQAQHPQDQGVYQIDAQAQA